MPSAVSVGLDIVGKRRQRRRFYHGVPVEVAEIRTKRGDIYSPLRRHFGWE
jgi:hypothetical protein